MLLIPTAFIGAGFPLLSELLMVNERDTETSDSRLLVSNLYAMNTSGAIFGSLLTGFFLLPQFGLAFSIVVPALVNFLVAFLAIYLLSNNKEYFKGLAEEYVKDKFDRFFNALSFPINLDQVKVKLDYIRPLLLLLFL